MIQLFNRLALCLYKKACIHRLPIWNNRQVEADLEKLYPGQRKEQLLTEYYVNKLAKSLMICAVGVFFGVALGLRGMGDSLLNDSGGIVRGTYEEGIKEVRVETSLGETQQSFVVEVSPKLFSEEELAALRKSFGEQLPKLIVGDNASLNAVTEDLILLEIYEGYPFAVDWESDCADVLRSDGVVEEVEEARDVVLKATICYEEKEWEECLNVRVVPPTFSEEERIHRELEELLFASEQETRYAEEWLLPTAWEGQELVWQQEKENTGMLMGVGGVVVALLVYLLADKDLHDEVEKRRQQMKKSYPDVIHKLVLYLGAGMTIRSTFQRIAQEYEKTKSADGEKKMEKNPIYEEFLHTCRELKAGVSEGAAYEHFGKRTGLQEYIRLSTLLSQNLKKGNSTLMQRLREEAVKASAERIQYGKRLGEEAVTKLLLPMVMMLLVVMLMIMVPAFSTVGT